MNTHTPWFLHLLNLRSQPVIGRLVFVLKVDWNLLAWDHNLKNHAAKANKFSHFCHKELRLGFVRCFKDAPHSFSSSSLICFPPSFFKFELSDPRTRIISGVSCRTRWTRDACAKAALPIFQTQMLQGRIWLFQIKNVRLRCLVKAIWWACCVSRVSSSVLIFLIRKETQGGEDKTARKIRGNLAVWLGTVRTSWKAFQASFKSWCVRLWGWGSPHFLFFPLDPSSVPLGLLLQILEPGEEECQEGRT